MNPVERFLVVFVADLLTASRNVMVRDKVKDMVIRK